MKLLHAPTLAIAVIATACASSSLQPSIPEGYSGPTSSIVDTATPYYPKRADLFYLAKIDDQQVRDSLTATLEANRGRGMTVVPKVLTHNVPARPAKFSVVAIVHFAAPILAMTNGVYEARGIVEFTPEENKVYVVRGNLSSDVSSVWIEEESTGRVMGNKVEVRTKK